MEQSQLEMEYSKEGIAPYIKSLICANHALKGEVLSIAVAIERYLDKPHDYSYETTSGESKVRNDLIEAHDALREEDAERLVWSAVCLIVSKNKQELQHQAMVGVLINRFNSMSSFYRQLLTVEIILTHLVKLSFLTVTTTASGTYWKSAINIKDTSMIEKRSYILPSITPLLPIMSNKTNGYIKVTESIIAGGSLKYHDNDIALDHINRKNAIAYSYEQRLEQLVRPVFNYERKLKKNGEYETDLDITKRKFAFDKLHDELPDKVGLMLKAGNVFYLAHRYCSRLRTYVKSVHFNYLGTKYLKAMVQFHNKEVSTGEW